jgi:hypothetical protein
MNNSDYPRDMVGYGGNPHWPSDAATEAFLSEVTGTPTVLVVT